MFLFLRITLLWVFHRKLFIIGFMIEVNTYETMLCAGAHTFSFKYKLMTRNIKIISNIT